MKYLRITLFLALVAAVSIPLATHAADISDAQRLSRIEESCTVLQTSLEQLQRRDLVARTNRGREYENVNKQIDALSERLRHNNLDTSNLVAPTASFKGAVVAFRDAYVRYDDSMKNLRDIDCTNSNSVADFAKALEQSRVLRAAVGVEVTKGENALVAYRQAVVALQSVVPAPLNQEAQ